MARRQQQQEAGVPELQERVVCIKRVAKTVKGGRRMQLTALVVVGDGQGNVGVGLGKSKEVPTAIAKGVEDAKKNMFKVSLTEEGTVPHEVLGEYGAGRVLIKPAIRGTGVKAGGPVRAIMELAMYEALYVEDAGSRNGVYCNGIRLAKPHKVASGDSFSVGTNSTCSFTASALPRRKPLCARRIAIMAW